MKELEPPRALAGFVLARIERERLRIVRRKLILSYFGLGSSFVLAIFAGIVYGQAFLQSEFWSMLSLAFSDVTVVASNWNTFTESLLETFPTMYAIIFLVPIFTMLISAYYYTANRSNYYNKHKFI